MVKPRFNRYLISEANFTSTVPCYISACVTDNVDQFASYATFQCAVPTVIYQKQYCLLGIFTEELILCQALERSSGEMSYRPLAVLCLTKLAELFWRDMSVFNMAS